MLTLTLPALTLLALLSGCGTSDPSSAPATSTTAPDTTTTTSPDDDPVEPTPSPQGPLDDEIGLITEISPGDLSCYLSATTPSGVAFETPATFGLCEQRDELLGTTAWLVYTIELINDCESNEPCGRTREARLVSDTVPLGDDWLVTANDDWMIVVGQRSSWDGTNGTGDLSYYGCTQAARAANSTDGCLALDGGTVTCQDGLCVDAWRNGDVSYSLTSLLTDAPETGSTTLQVTNGDEVIVESAGLELVASS